MSHRKLYHRPRRYPPVAELRELLAKASQRPWKWSGNSFQILNPFGSSLPNVYQDCELIVAAVNALPALLDRLAQLEAIKKAATAWVGSYNEDGASDHDEAFMLATLASLDARGEK